MAQEPDPSRPPAGSLMRPLGLRAAAGMVGSQKPPGVRVRPRPIRVWLALVWSAVLAVGGGVLCARIQAGGWFLLSLVVLWLLGLPGGLMARRITGGQSGLVALAQAAAVIGATVIMQTIWLRENIRPQPEWGAAMALLPEYYRGATVQAVAEAICGLCGAYVAGERLLRAPNRPQRT